MYVCTYGCYILYTHSDSHTHRALAQQVQAVQNLCTRELITNVAGSREHCLVRVAPKSTKKIGNLYALSMSVCLSVFVCVCAEYLRYN